MLFFAAPALWSQALIDDTGEGTTPHPSAVLELMSNDKGLKLTQLPVAPVNPAPGLMYYDTTRKCVRAYVENAWVPVGTFECAEATTAPEATFDEAAETGTVSISYENTTNEPMP